ncbi:MAG: hypothetical protein ACOYT4_00020 [Nanoarchaeota archaeon]
MEQILIVRIFAGIIYLLILGIFVAILVKGLISKKIEQLYRSKGSFIYTKEQNPREYWIGILWRMIFVILAVIVGFFIYEKLF